MKKDIIETILRDFASRPISYDVYIVANTQDKTPKCGPAGVLHASTDEFFSREEFSEIASAIFDIFGYVKVFYSELDFCRYALQHEIKREECLVYNLARDGRCEGKKSFVPALCDLLGLRYTGSNAFVISLLRNKYLYSVFLGQFQVPVPRSWVFNHRTGFSHGEPHWGQKIIVKNIRESASIGLTASNVITYSSDESKESIAGCCERMGCYDVLVQEYIEGAECEVLVLEYGGHYIALDPIQIDIDGEDILSSEISNSYRYSFHALESSFPPTLCGAIQRYAEQAASLLDIRTYARFDFRIDQNMNCFLIDIAGTPYTIKHSSIAYLFQEKYHLKYKDIYKVIACLALDKKM